MGKKISWCKMYPESKSESESETRRGITRMNMIDDSGFIEAKTRLTQARAEIFEMKAAQMRGELVDKAEAKRSWQEKASIVKNKLLAIPEMAPMLYEKGSIGAIKKELKSKIYEILEELAMRDNE